MKHNKKLLRKLREAGEAFAQRHAGQVDRLSDLDGFAPNPGNLRGRCYVPEDLAPGAPLVVVLHGCTQTAAGYDQGSGWSRLADRHGFALLFPEQQRANNPGLCFNWFSASHAQRGMGEAASIHGMVQKMREAHGVDPARIFVTGLSAGGAMASVMLANYPELFAGGAIIAGLAYGCASGIAEAFECMAGRARPDAAELAAAVRRASPHAGPWPRISVWQGSSDATVVPSNADAVVLQWAQLHGLQLQPSRTELVEGYPRRVWLGRSGEEVIEHYTITGMAHGVPLMPGSEEGQSGEAGAYMIDVGLSSTDRIAAFFGIAPPPAENGKRRRSRVETGDAKPAASGQERAATSVPAGVQGVIEDALRAAGLMR